MRRLPLFALVASGLALAATACSSSAKPASSATSPPRVTTTTAPSGRTVAVTHTTLGNVLVDSRGLTLYAYTKDKPGTSTCTGVCAQAWPPETVTGTITVSSGLHASMFSTISRPDHTKQLAAAGRPLYTFSGDRARGDATGQGMGDFYAVAPTGRLIGAPS